MSGLIYVSNFLSSAGLNRSYAEDLADRLAARGRLVIRTSSVLSRAWRLADMLRTIWMERRRYDVALVDVYSGFAFLWAESACFELRRLRKPYVLTLHGGSLPEFAARWPRRVRRLLESATVVTAPSEYLAARMRPYRSDIVVVRNAIDVSEFEFAQRSRLTPTLVWVRAFHEIYNPLLAVEVVARLESLHRETHLTMLGPDKDGTREAVERRASALGVRERITFVGPVPKSEIPKHLARADIFINTTNVDNTPVSVLEAMATGLCVVSTSVGGIPFLLKDGETALLVPPREPDAMAGALARVLSDEQLAGRLSRGAYDFASRCDWTHVLAQWDDLLANMTGHA